MSNEQLVIDMLRSIQGRLGSTDGAMIAVRSEIQHLSRRIDNLVGTSLLRLDGSRNESAGIVSGLQELAERLNQLERRIGPPAATAQPKAAAKTAPSKPKAPPRKAPARKAATKRKAAKKGKR